MRGWDGMSRILTIDIGGILPEELVSDTDEVSLYATSLALLSPGQHAVFGVLCAGYPYVSSVVGLSLGVRDTQYVRTEGWCPGVRNYHGHSAETGPVAGGSTDGCGGELEWFLVKIKKQNENFVSFVILIITILCKEVQLVIKFLYFMYMLLYPII